MEARIDRITKKLVYGMKGKLVVARVRLTFPAFAKLP